MQTKYCPSCGQREGLSPRSIRNAFTEILGNVFSYDNKLWRSLIFLSFRPGQLTKAYCAGQRSTYFDPLRMFLFLTVVVFLAPDTIDLVSFRIPDAWLEPAAEGVDFAQRL